MSTKTTEINFTIGLEENQVPENIAWSAKDGCV